MNRSTRKIIKHILSVIAPFFSVNKLLELNNINFIAPFYHCVSDKPTPHLKHLYPVKTVKEFEQDLDFLLKHFTPISLTDLILKTKNKDPFTKPTCFLSFDDGMQECYSVVAPILKRKGIPCTFFITTDFIDNKNLFYRHSESLEKEGVNTDGFLETGPYLTTNQIKNLLADGFDIGSHSKSHLEYSTLCLPEQVSETEASIQILENDFKIKTKAFSFPFTDYNITADFFEWSKIKLDLTFGCAGIKETPYSNHIQRIPMENGWTAEKNIKTELLYTKCKGLLSVL